jgi:hypothetical protein
MKLHRHPFSICYNKVEKQKILRGKKYGEINNT